MIAIRPQLTQSQIPIEWDQLIMMRDVLKPLYVFTKELQRVQYTAGDYYISYGIAAYELARIARKQPDVREAALEMRSALANRSEAITCTMQFQAALYMDPRYTNETTTLNTEEQNKIVVRTSIIYYNF